ncbi:MAG: dipeptidyl peptidase 3 [Bacteroidales bacterium]|nr:dipeptidyl peptidase 3 [Bacteroidales bacterium]
MKKIIILLALATTLFSACKNPENQPVNDDADFDFVIDRFADIEIMRYRVDDWDSLSLQQKELVYYLSQAACCGRDILFDQNCEANLLVKSTIDNIFQSYNGDKNNEDWMNFVVYAKRFWFSNGIHHHYANDKFFPEISREYFISLLDNSNQNEFELDDYQSFEEFKNDIVDIVFNPQRYPNKICQNTDVDLVKNSAVNFYSGVSEKEVESYYQQLKSNFPLADPERAISYGLNSKLIKNADGQVVEDVYKADGLYGKAIKQIIYWLEKAAAVAENPAQKAHIEKLMEFYTNGDLKTWDDYNILWVQDTISQVDYVNGFIEVYNDPLGQKGAWEGLVNYKDFKNNKRTEIISENAQWFEDHSPIEDQFKKKTVKGVIAKVITVAQLGGDSYPAPPIGINLPNANWIRKDYGSKSVTIENLMYAYDQARQSNGVGAEFYYSDEEAELIQKYGYVSDNLQVDMHECLGHGSGQMLPGVSDAALKNYHSVIEETRADLFSLYYIADPQMVKLGLLPDNDAYKACYYKYILNGLMLQLNRIELGNEITEAHMRNRAIIARWCLENGQADHVVELMKRDDKTFVKINDYEKLRQLFGKLLSEIQTIKSTGNYAQAKQMVEKYGIKIDADLHREVKDRYALLDIAPYGGFVNPTFDVKEKDGKIVDIQLVYPNSFVDQMLEYDQKYNFLSK